MTNTDPNAPAPPMPDELVADPLVLPPSDYSPPLLDENAAERVVPPPAWSDLYPASSPAPRRRRRPSGVQLGIGLLLILLGAVWLLQASGAIDVSLSAVLPAALILLGALLVVSARTGRHTGLIVVGVILSLVTAVISSVDIRLDGGIGDRVARPSNPAEVASDYTLAIGSLEVDLSAVGFDAADEVSVSVGMGELVVVVPADVPVQVRAHAGVGNVVLFGEDFNGLDVDAEADDGAGTILTLNLEVGLGSIEVFRGGAAGS